jgi:hypothetical protein
MATGTTSPSAWQRVFRDGIAPQLSTEGLQGLKAALERNDGRLITGATTSPPPLQCMQNEPVESCCPLCFALLDGKKPYEVSVGPMEQRFSERCFEADQLCGEPAADRYFINWVDQTPRETMRQALLAEVNLALAQRKQEQPTQQPTPLARLLTESDQAVL